MFLTYQNPWWTDSTSINKDAKIREFEASSVKFLPGSVIDLELKSEAINIVHGPRQTGKSTALKLLIRNLLHDQVPAERIFYFSCDALDTRKDLIDLVLVFLNSIKDQSGELSENHVFLDEVSSIKDWPYAIKWLADGGFLAKSRVILTGSSSINLKKSGELLPGRRRGGKDIRLLPISYFDYLKLIYPDLPIQSKVDSFSSLEAFEKRCIRTGIDLKRSYGNFLLTGGFLKMIDSVIKNEPFFDTVEIYKVTLLSELAKFGKKELFARRILSKIISGLTAETSYTNVAEEAELGSKNTAVDYLNFFGESFFLVETLFYNIQQKRPLIKKNKKYYPTDPFLFWMFNSFIYGSNQIEYFYQRYLESPLDSQIAEAFVASELYKQELEFFYSKNSRELDFYIPKYEMGIEVKYKSKISSYDLEGLKYVNRKIVLSKDVLEKRNGVLIIPIYLFGLLDAERII